MERRWTPEQQDAIEAEAQRILSEKGEQACAKYLNDYSVREAQDMLRQWRELAVYLIVKYNDMAVKPEKDGKFELTPDGLGATVQRPGYTEPVRKAIAKQTGDWYVVPQSTDK